MKQFIRINTDGTIQGLDLQDKGIDLKRMGESQVERWSDILWDNKNKFWYIKFLKGKLIGQSLHIIFISSIIELRCKFVWTTWNNKLAFYIKDGIVGFDNYQDAVEVEKICYPYFCG